MGLAIKRHAPAGSVKKRTTVILGAGILLLAGAYLLLTTASPAIMGTQLVRDIFRKDTYSEPIGDDAIHIPAIAMSMALNEGGKNEKAALSIGAVHRMPQNGSPVRGGNFVVAAHRFTLAWNPVETVRKSPLYNFHHIEIGDSILVDYQSRRHEYIVAQIRSVKATDVGIERKTVGHQLTLYSCELAGSAAKRDMLIALPKSDRAMLKKYQPRYL